MCEWDQTPIFFKFPENKLLSDWITHGASLILLILLNCSNSLLVRGVYIDAEEPEGQCVVFPVYYIRLFFQKERTKKENRMKEKLEKIDQNNAVLTEKPTMNHSIGPTIIKMNNVDPEEVPIAKDSGKSPSDIHITFMDSKTKSQISEKYNGNNNNNNDSSNNNLSSHNSTINIGDQNPSNTSKL